MKKLIFLFLFVLQLGVIYAQPAPPSGDEAQFCSNLNFIADNFIYHEKLVSDSLKAKEGLLGDVTHYYAVKIELEGFDGVWYKDLMLGSCFDFESEKTFTQAQCEMFVESLKHEMAACLGTLYKLQDGVGDGITFKSTETGANYYNFPVIDISWNNSINPEEYKVVVRFIEPVF